MINHPNRSKHGRDVTIRPTPGPWTYSGLSKASNFADHAGIVYAEGCNLVRVRGGIADDRKVAEANGRLIAAAPDLLIVCQALEAHCRVETGTTGEAHAAEGRAIRRQLQSAIAKATGKLEGA